MRRGHAATARGVPRDPHEPTVLIAHGAWVDGSGWREVIARLQHAHVDVVAVQNPLTSLADDVDAVTRAIKQLAGPVLLVGHGYGGTVITQAGNHPRVTALIFVAAFAPDSGESTMDSQADYPPPAAIARLEVDSAGFLYLAPDAIAQFLAQDLPAADSRVLAAAQQPIRVSAFTDKVAVAAWRDRPCWYVVASEDGMISPALQRQIAVRIQARVSTLKTGHLPFLSKPTEVGDVIVSVVDFIRRAKTPNSSIVSPRDER